MVGSSPGKLSCEEVLARFYGSILTDKKRRDGIHVSTLVYDCLRRGYYDATLGPRFNLETYLKFWIGKSCHTTPILRHHELSLEWNGVKGTVDEYEDGVIVDKKTTREIPRSPYPSHVKQLEYYKVLLESNGYPVEQGFILYIDVATPGAHVLEAPLRETGDVQRELMEKYTTLTRALEDGTPPRGVPGWLCRYCGFSEECGEGGCSYIG